MLGAMSKPPPPAPAVPADAVPAVPAVPDGAAVSDMPAAPLPAEPSFLDKIMEQNPYFSAGAGLMGLGVALTALRTAGKLGATAARRRMLITLEMTSKDKSYPWFLEWMAAQSAHAREVPPSDRGLLGALRGRVTQLPSHELAVETNVKQHENGSSDAVFNLVPGPGTHYFSYMGHWFQVRRERDSKLMDLHSGTPWETLTLTGLSSSRTVLPSLLDEARALAERGSVGKTVVYTAWGVDWRPFGKPRSRREMGSVVLAEGVAERIERDIRAFLARGKWYAERGIPYRRGYMLYGPPGSGKTSFIQALAGSIGYNICLMNLAERGLTDDKLNHLLGLVPDRSIILLEDVDSAFTRRVQTSEDGYKSSVTFSGLLNALDGVASSEERIIFMTTNHAERLDPALIRPGRVDMKEVLDDAHGEQACRLYTKFYGHRVGENAPEDGQSPDPLLRSEHLSEDEISALGKQVGEVVDRARAEGRNVSMASLQGHFIRSGARESVAGVDALCVARA
ncbi:hypothetical protein CcaverHIS002_0403330 [Cutaneotrichosporon cavernicola]|uniref:Mitochondrial chaperone BCS1 n=1 Tax=Cutaneotrichosporon cavernicola TaxID=279322 RepID=A0AA48L3X4_9TREE|nr:uncharacterized protein CcaverHIS019_0403290 [Cutaneotrichosporon cavernicola]BEI83729.1 hypothetical protein CcaverHIS002_0403330 [Cutaneotrichosporon cavernicola]BEI91509.1 hypothetical protein CcaverHIS019_0403290 [Cutaneotrichosporon cavernicola]BEI99284.1 hypothetical protein CcaverHIS631_0403270 [Cutaneotrichosporon cavernicola]BEJ07061.1 hypothetical protein CcaverHIS641_0403300 [Cutaneotrichosporon cavernicola]